MFYNLTRKNEEATTQTTQIILTPLYKEILMNEELETIILGEKIGRGVHRDVYVFAPDKTKVIKVAKEGDGRAVNLIEHRLWWDTVYSTPMEKWFAPVFLVSESGKYLIQQRAEKLPKDQYPEKIPHFFTDTKYDNFGYIKGKGVVCIDYGSFGFFKRITAKMVKAEWWE